MPGIALAMLSIKTEHNSAILGLLFLAVGFWAEFDLSNYMEMSPEFSGTAPYVFIGIGMLILVVSSIAFSCIIKAQPVLLYIWVLACTTMMCVGLIATLACFRHTFAKALYNGLNQAVINYSQLKTNLDFAQVKMHCCGVNNYTDWIRMSPQRVIPVSCCLDPNNCVTANYSDVFQRGCYHVIAKTIDDNAEIFVFLAVATTILPSCGTILACVLANVVNKSKYDAMD
ncbi:tetraspanin-7-like [Manduca sexta]|uniref:tetraspanin-7-like n=1 Tax=Manduca sexta TaxID=7130 RepID=UPI0018904BA5|nr:tetraspanin-7-like [Manduca sexta]